MAQGETLQKNKHEINMTEGPILKKMLLFSFPLMGSSIPSAAV